MATIPERVARLEVVCRRLVEELAQAEGHIRELRRGHVRQRERLDRLEGVCYRKGGCSGFPVAGRGGAP